MDRQVLPSRALVAAGALAFVGVFGSPMVDWLWLALVPAAALFALGIQGLRRPPLAVRVAAILLSWASLALVALATVGLVVQQWARVEPAWLTRAVTLASWLFVVSLVAYGLASAATGFLPRAPSLLLAVSLPMGFGLDALLGRIPGLFLHGAGFHLGFGLFALCLTALGLATERARRRTTMGT